MDRKYLIIFMFGCICSTSIAVSFDKDYLKANLEWYCKTVCEGCGGYSHLAQTIPLCICEVDRTVEDADRLLMQKTADLLNMDFKIFERRSKRDAENEEESDEEEEEDVSPLEQLRMKLRSRFQKFQNDAEDPLIGAIHLPELPQFNLDNKKLMPFFSRSANGGGLTQITSPLINNDPLPSLINDPLSPDSTKALLTNIRSKLDKLIERSDKTSFDSARAALEIEKMRNSLKEIAQLNLRPFSPSPLFKDLSIHGIVGKKTPGKEENSTTPGIITQSPDLVDEE